ncbi:hypothetical protein BP6252_13032 [Coleophoma cylindrospora]|uniref:Mid2 domain-containing protein n=1 Tax=Coleophoma cylindrospora TaxID=1849047 RepID=A0A3D8QDP1_9HELO|nr:hypothetical protein BP6252_13032 [Coleophoma cylindrospora]
MLLLCAFRLLLLSATASATCYFRNGTAVADTSYQPCQSSGHSMCCATNRVTYLNDCLSDGLCLEVSTGRFFRESCSDATWASPNCLANICADASNGGYTDSDAPLTYCATDNTYCCGYSENSSTCCSSSSRFSVAAIAGSSSVSSTSSRTSLTSTATTSTTTGTLTSSSSTTSSTHTSSTGSASSKSNNSSDGTKVGIGIGVGLGLAGAIAITAIFFFVRRLRKRRAIIGPTTAANDLQQGQTLNGQMFKAELHATAADTNAARYHRLPGNGLADHSQVYEMPVREPLTPELPFQPSRIP